MEDLKKKTYSECSDMTRSSQSNFCSGSVLRTSDSNGNSLFIESAHDETDDCLKEKTCYLFQPVSNSWIFKSQLNTDHSVLGTQIIEDKGTTKRS